MRGFNVTGNKIENKEKEDAVLERSYESETRKKFQLIDPIDPLTTRYVIQGRIEPFFRELTQEDRLADLRQNLRYYLSGRLPRILRQEREKRGITKLDWAEGARKTEREIYLAETGMDIEGARWILWSLVESDWNPDDIYQTRFDGELDLDRQISLYVSFWRGIIRKARERAELNYEDLATAIGMKSKHTLRSIEYGMKSNIVTAARVGAYLMHLARSEAMGRAMKIEMEMVSRDRRWKSFVENPWVDFRMKYYLDPYHVAGLVGVGVKSWIRWECGFFLGDDEEVLARAALKVLQDDRYMDLLFTQRAKQAPFYGPMKRMRREFLLHTYDSTMEHFKLNTKLMAHYWGVLENGCTPDSPRDDALKKLTSFVFKAQDWKAIRLKIRGI